MGLKRLILQKTLMQKAITAELTLPGDPMIYSVRYPLEGRYYSVQHFRNKRWRPLLKTFFRTMYSTKTPSVLIVRFYVSPPEDHNIKPADLRNERIPAVEPFELCDYLLFLMESIHGTLINTYRQLVKIDMEKFYSKDPRTVIQFMTWSDYVDIQNSDPVHSKAKAVRKTRRKACVQPVSAGDEADDGVCQAGDEGSRHQPDDGPSSCDSSL